MIEYVQNKKRAGCYTYSIESARSIGYRYTHLYNFKITSLKNDNVLDKIAEYYIQMKIVYMY